MTITAEPAATTEITTDEVKARKLAQLTSMLDQMRAEGSDLLEAANRTPDPEAAVTKATAALTAIENAHRLEKAAKLALDSARDPADVDVVKLRHAMFKQHPAKYKVGTPFVPPPGMHVWTCQDTLTELRRARPRVLEMFKPVPSGTEGTWADFFAGAGGSSSGIGAVPGALVKIAVNHWPLAIASHQFNHQDTDHDQANLARTDPSRYPTTDFGWFSPECTRWSVARGEKCDYDMESEQLVLDIMDDDESAQTPEAKEERWRSRMLMRDVVRFARHHRYKAIIVENVPDIVKWAALDRWLAEMSVEGYRWKIVNLNSAFAGATGAPAPQLRDRVYFVFWLACYKTPNWDKWLRPKGYCPGCQDVVPAIYTPKPGPRRPMRYGPRSQYTYRCPKKACRGKAVQPLVMPAGAAIDWNLPTQRIGDRKRPLAQKTRDRIAAGLERYCRPITVQTSGHTFERRPGVRSWPVDRPFTTQDTSVIKSVAAGPGMLVPTGGARSTTVTTVNDPMLTQTGTESRALVVPLEGRAHASGIRRMDEPMRAQTARHQDGLLGLPESLLVPLRNNGTAEDPRTTPYRTFAAGGTHHALVMRNNTGGAEMLTPTDEPIRTLTTGGHQSLVEWDDDDALYHYSNHNLRPLDAPLATQMTVEGDALIGGARRFVDVDDCTLRMLAVKEIQAGMAFDPNYTLLGGVKRWHVRMLGNAVTPNAARDLTACVMEAVTGIEMPLFDMPLWTPN